MQSFNPNKSLISCSIGGKSQLRCVITVLGLTPALIKSYSSAFKSVDKSNSNLESREAGRYVGYDAAKDAPEDG